MVYLGKEQGTKASHLYDSNNGTLHISRDIVFQEGNFCNWHEVNSNGVAFPDTVNSIENTIVQRVYEENEQIMTNEQEPATPA